MAAVGLLALASTPRAQEDLTLERLEAEGAVVGDIAYDIHDVFETDEAEEDRRLYRIANRLHVLTRRSTIRAQMLLRPGEPFSKRKLEESERLLRSNRYLSEAFIRPTRYENGRVDLTVMTRDNWTLLPRLAYSREAGETKYTFGFEEQNFLGGGAQLKVERSSNPDRRSTLFEFTDRNLGRTWLGLGLGYRDSDDGNAQFFRVNRPFFSLDERWAAGFEIGHDDRVEPLYSRGDTVAKFRDDARHVSTWFGWSDGLVDNWVSRFTIGMAFRDDDFAEAEDPDFADVVPESRTSVYPFIRYQRIENRFAVAQNLNQIVRPEDLQLGTEFTAGLGFAAATFGSDQDRWLFDAGLRMTRGTSEKTLLIGQAAIDGRLDGSDPTNILLTLQAEYFRRQSERRLLYGSLTARAGHELDLENPVILGGETGLRGYERAFGNGDGNVVATLEQRYFTNWYPWRLFRVGGAVYVDVGRTFGEDVTGRSDSRWLANVGFGLRLGSTRADSNKVFHFDLAFPLVRDDGTDEVQVIIEGRRGF